jgi:molybdate transport system ATP-binding protein
MTPRLSVALRVDVREFSLDVAWTAGDGVTVLFGPSGAGKTLTLHCLAGLVRPHAGRIVVDGRVLFDGVSGVDVPPQGRRIGYVFQGHALFPHLTVRANIGFGLRREPAAIRAERVADVTARLELRGLEDRYPHELSGGQRQRVALGRALAIAPTCVLLDEPLSALDLPLRRALREELRACLAAWKVPAVLVTHDLAEAYELGDHVVIYEAGRVRQAAPRAELLRRPASEAVARILGFRNILRGRVLEATSARVRLAWRGQVLEALNDEAQPHLPTAGGEVAFFVRPEDPRLLRKDGPVPDPTHHGNILSGSVVEDIDRGVTHTLRMRLDEPGPTAQAGYDIELDVPRFVYTLLQIAQDRHWGFSIHRGSVHLLSA